MAILRRNREIKAGPLEQSYKPWPSAWGRCRLGLMAMRRSHHRDIRHHRGPLCSPINISTSAGLPFRRVGMVYRFEDFTAYGLDQALGYVEGYDRAVAALADASHSRPVRGQE